MKKHLFQDHDLDKEKIAKELGDVAWYLALTAYGIGYKLEDMLYRTLVRMIERGQTEGLEEKLDFFFAAGKLTEEEYQELLDMMRQ